MRVSESELLNKLRVPLLLGVILIHSNAPAFTTGNPEALTAFNLFMGPFDYLLSLMVPAFFFISGYFFFLSGFLNRNSFIDKLKRRSHSLLAPYLLWNTIGLLLTAIKASSLFPSLSEQYEGVFSSLFSVLKGYVELPHTGSPYDFPLWFIRNLIILSLLTPVISVLFKRLKVGALILFAAIAQFADFIPFGLSNSLWYFSLGASIPLLKVDLIKLSKPYLLYICILATCYILSALGIISIPYYISFTFGILMLIGIANHLLTNITISRKVAQGVFFIYAVHGLYCVAIAKLVCHLIPTNTNQMIPFLQYILCFTINLLIAMIIYRLFEAFISKRFPHTAKLFCGGR